MLRNFLKNKKAQNTAEYALLIALVVAGIIAMQQYAQRALQARVRDASLYMITVNDTLGNTAQYEPYYQQSNYEVSRNSYDQKTLGEGLVAQGRGEARTRGANGFQKATYDTTETVDTTGADVPDGI